MIFFLLLFLAYNTNTMNRDNDYFIDISTNPCSHDIFVTIDNINTFQQMIETHQVEKNTPKIKVLLEGVQKCESYKNRIQALNKLLATKSDTNNFHLLKLYNAMAVLKDQYLSTITTHTHATAFISSFAVLLLKKYCHKNAAFLLLGSLSIPYISNYTYIKEKNQGSFENAIPDFGIFVFLAFFLFGLDKLLTYL